MFTREVSKLYLLAVKLSAMAHAVKSYCGQPYWTHLDDVEEILRDYGFGKDNILMICSRLHDIMEDCGYTYNDIKKLFGNEIANICYLVSDFKGRTRAERKPDQLYYEMSEEDRAVILKVADRIANARKSIINNDSMGDTYIEEYGHFRELLYTPAEKIAPMWAELDELMGFKK